MSDAVRFGLVGAGRIAETHVQAFEGLDGARLCAVADVRPEAAAGLSARLGCPGFGSHEEMSEACELDAVLVCTPPASHAGISRHFLRRGIHVLCEKPLSVDNRGARLMALEARRSGAILAMASKFRFVDDVLRARELVESGAVGEIVQVESSFTGRVDMSGRWNSDPALSGGGVLIDNGTHAVDILRFFLGSLVDVQIVEGARSQGLGVEETVRLFVRNARGVLGSVDLSWSLGRESDAYLSIYGTKGTIHVGWRESRYRIADGGWISFGTGYDKVRAFRAQIASFARAVRGEGDFQVRLEDALASVEVIEAAYQALHGSRWTAIGPEPERVRRPRRLSLVAGLRG